MHADYINGYIFYNFSSRSILLHSFLCKMCVPRHIKTLLYCVFVMEKVHTVVNRMQVLFKQFWKCIVCSN
jgi:hypothetical protein